MIAFRLPADAPGAIADELRSIPGVRVYGSTVRAVPDAAAAVARVLGVDHPGLKLVATPTASVGETSVRGWDRLFGYQRDGARALAAGGKSALFWATGLGKGGAAMAATDLVRANRALVTTRSIGREVYLRDSAWISGRTVAILVGTGRAGNTDAVVRHADRRLASLRKRGGRGFAVGGVKTALDMGADLVVVGYETLAARADELRAVGWPVWIVDESHMVKARLAGRVKAAHSLVGACTRRWLLSATPVRDRLRDLWAQWAIVDPIGAGTSYRWVVRYCNAAPGRYGGLDTTGVSNVDELRERVAFWADVRTRDELRGVLPAKRRVTTRLPSDVAARAFGAARGSRTTLEAAVAHAAAAKLDPAVDQAVECLIGAGKVILVGNRVAWVPRAARAVEAALPAGVRARTWLRCATGEVPIADRLALAREYMDQPGPACLVVTADAVGESIDLQDCDLMIVAALPWTPGSLVQLEGRVSRLGQRRPVQIVYLVAEGTIDEEIESLVLDKAEAVAQAGVDVEGSAPEAGTWGPSESEIIARLNAWLAASASEAVTADAGLTVAWPHGAA